MPANPAMPWTLALVLALANAGAWAQAPVAARQPAELAGTWELAVDNRSAACRLILRAEKSDKGDYFLGMPAACRHAMPSLAKVGRWALPDATHLTLDEPAGTPALTLAAAGDGFAGTRGQRAYTLTRVGSAPDAAATGPLDGPSGRAALVAVAQHPAAQDASARVVTDRPADVAGRYAVMREKRDTGCMLTLDDKTRGKAGGDRAQLAPGCRDQGIVIFDPVGWRLVRGELVLTARAGHTTRLDKVEEGNWAKDAKEGKPLGLKKL